MNWKSVLGCIILAGLLGSEAPIDNPPKPLSASPAPAAKEATLSSDDAVILQPEPSTKPTATVKPWYARKEAQTATNSPTTKPAAEKSFEVPDLNMKFVRLEPGEFLMGSPADEAGRRDNELQHRVRLTKPFYIQTTEVSQIQYKTIMGSRPSYFRGDDLPVENISWDEAVSFCDKLSAREGRKFRLPTEAEWEYAARGGKPGPVSGTGKLDEMAWQANNSGTRPLDSAKLWDTDPNGYFERLADNAARTRAVGRGPPNDWGLHDMQGNVSEWVADWYSATWFADEAEKVDPPGPRESDLGSRVIRGGAWSSDPRNCRVAFRDWNTPDSRSGSRGFRMAVEAEN